MPSNRFLSIGIAVLSSAFGMTLLAAGASAQRVIVFGDSLSDNGNLSALGFFPAPSPPYYTGPNGFARFSNGPVWVEQLYGPLNSPLQGTGLAGNVDLAFGGARTDNANAGLPPDIPLQIQAFQGLGGTIGAKDTVTVWGGANNIFDFFASTPPANINQATITANSVAAATSEVGNIQTLVGLGARTLIVPNLPPIGSAPAFSNPAVTQAATFASAIYNSALAQGLQQAAAAVPAGTNIIQADINSAFSVVIANPSAYGFKNVTAACVSTPSCVASAKANQNTFLFWDGVHPTEAGHALIANYVGLLLNTAPAAASQTQLGEVGLRSNLQVTDTVFDRLRNWLSGVYQNQNGLYAEVIGARDSEDARGTHASHDFDLAGVRGGMDKKFDTSLIGVSAAILDGSQSGSALKSDIMTARGDLYATTLMGQAFLSGDLGASALWFEKIHRPTGFGPLATDGTAGAFTFNATAEGGYVFNLGGVQLIPSARINYIHGHIDDYNENSPVLALGYASRDVNAVLAGARLRAVTYFTLGTQPASAFAEAGYEDYVSLSQDAITAQLAGNTALPILVSPDDPNGPGLGFKGGVSSKVTENVSVDVVYGVTLNNGDGTAQAGHIRIKSPF